MGQKDSYNFFYPTRKTSRIIYIHIFKGTCRISLPVREPPYCSLEWYITRSLFASLAHPF